MKRFLHTESTSRADESPKFVLEGAAPSLRATFSQQIIEDVWDDPKEFFDAVSDLPALAARHGMAKAEAKNPNAHYWKKFLPLEPPRPARSGKTYSVIKLTLWGLLRPNTEGTLYSKILVTTRFGNMRDGQFFYAKNFVQRYHVPGHFAGNMEQLSHVEQAVNRVEQVLDSPTADKMAARLRIKGFRSV